MEFGKDWSRRRFLAVSSAAAAQAAVGLNGLGQTTGAAPASEQGTARILPPPEVISASIQPLMKGHTARPLRYHPDHGDFVIRNGGEYFNRPLYAPCSTEHSADFRVDASDVPEFSLYLPGHGGNLKLGFIAGNAAGSKGAASKWAAQADEVIARYRPGRMIYEIRDSILGSGVIRAELLTAAEGAGLILKVEGTNLPAGTRLAWAFGGVSGRKGRRNGDIGCEVQPVSQFFQLRPEECEGNTYISAIYGEAYDYVQNRLDVSKRMASHLVSTTCDLLLTFPPNSWLREDEFAAWNAPPAVGDAFGVKAKQAVLTGSAELQDTPLFVTIDRIERAATENQIPARPEASGSSLGLDPAPFFASRSAQVKALAATLTIDTPDEYINAVGTALAIAAETLWDARQQCVLHGGVAWRVALAGWRGPYVLDSLGQHDRAQQHIRHWLKKQNAAAITTGASATGQVTGPWDPAPNIHRTRKESLLHSNGDLSGNHYDMNLVFIDMMLRHLMWTGDLAFAREVWPALQRHLAWERRLFRRTYTTSDGKTLPLYEAYAAIWASDNLQYNGGGAMHSSAYNLFALRTAARLARLLGEDPSTYESEAALLDEGIQRLLWLPAQGAFAESKDLLGPQIVYSNPALWTIYHTIDSEAATPRQAWQICAERLHTLRPVPIHGEDLLDENLYMLSCTDWLPYMWSLNLLLLAENAHMALALWQAGMSDEAYRILKGSLLDSMFMGLCPGDFHMTSALDPHRQEAQRDFADPIGITARALVEGLFGIQPDLIANCIRIIRPSAVGNRVSLHHKDFDFKRTVRSGPATIGTGPVFAEVYEFTSRLPKVVPVTLILSTAQGTTTLPKVFCNGSPVQCTFDPEAVGTPQVVIQLPAQRTYNISVESKYGDGDENMMWDNLHELPNTYRIGDSIVLPKGVTLAQIDDPQHALTAGHVTSPGFHTVFANIHDGECRWTFPISFNAKPAEPAFAPIPLLTAGAYAEPLDLTSLLKDQLNEIFTRVYAEPRSPYCSLAIADNLLGGWANPDNRAIIDDAGLRASGGLLKTPLGVPFLTPAGRTPNCLFLSYWKQDAPSARLPLTGRASGIYLLLAGTTLPQCSRMTHATVAVNYADGSSSKLALRNPETWWPIEQDYMLDDYLFVNDAPLPPRVDLRTGETRLLDPVAFHGKGRAVPGGAATILHLPLDSHKTLASLEIQTDLYGIVVALLAATLIRAE